MEVNEARSRHVAGGVAAPRRIRSLLATGSTPLGVSVQIPSPEVVEIAGFAGADFIYLDVEHSALGIKDVSDLVRAAWAVNIDCMVRVPSHEPTFIARVLDTGATGVIVPHVGNRDEAESAVAATRFAPRGIRGACPMIRASAYGAEPWAASTQRQDDDVFVWLMIEEQLSPEGIEEIVCTPGVDAISLGMADLKQSLGAADETHPVLAEMVSATRQACRDHGVALSTLASQGAPSLRVVASDRLVLVAGFRAALAARSTVWTTPNSSNEPAARS